jgi:hypothetical protein
MVIFANKKGSADRLNKNSRFAPLILIDVNTASQAGKIF